VMGGDHVSRNNARPPVMSLTGRYSRFAAAVAQSGPSDPDVRPHSDRRVLDGLIGPGSAADAG